MRRMCSGQIKIKPESAAKPRGEAKASAARSHFRGPENPGRATMCLQWHRGHLQAKPSPGFWSQTNACAAQTQEELSVPHPHKKLLCRAAHCKCPTGRKARTNRFQALTQMLRGGVTWTFFPTTLCVCMLTLRCVCVCV